MKKFLLIAAALASTAPALAAEPRQPEATIVFAGHNGIQDFEPITDQLVYLRAGHNKWYRATLFVPCIGLNHKVGISYETNPDGSFDRMSALRVDGQRCRLESLVESGPPPSREKNRKG